MLLAIDVGNTQTVLGLYDGAELLHMWRVATNKSHTSDELRTKIRPLLDFACIDTANIEGAVLASVVPRLTEEWCSALDDMLNLVNREGEVGAGAVVVAEEEAFAPVRANAPRGTLVVNAKSASALFKTNYRNPMEVGADRVADAVAARALFGAPCVVVDFGTATNIEVIDAQGYFVGGVIAPGIETSSNALFSHATKLAAIELIDPHTAIGGSTEEAIQAGILYGETDRVDGLVRRIFAELGYQAPVVATGGLAALVAGLSATIEHVVPELTLEGLRLIYESTR